MRKNLKKSESFEKKPKKTEKTKKKEYAFLLYPDSAIFDWIEIVKQLQQPFFTILHDKDINPDGTPKKPHYHVMVMFDNPRTEGTIKRVNLMCGGNGHFEELLSRRGYARYLCHMDNPEKYQYDPESVMSFFGANYLKETMSETARRVRDDEIFCDIINFCRENRIIAYCHLVDYCIRSKKDWLPYIRGRNGQAIVSYIKSYCWYVERQ